jgi:hypothetical protein
LTKLRRHYDGYKHMASKRHRHYHGSSRCLHHPDRPLRHGRQPRATPPRRPSTIRLCLPWSPNAPAVAVASAPREEVTAPATKEPRRRRTEQSQRRTGRHFLSVGAPEFVSSPPNVVPDGMGRERRVGILFQKGHTVLVSRQKISQSGVRKV